MTGIPIPPQKPCAESRHAMVTTAMGERRGRLKIFLGAAPGVGKTYEMLMAGRARHADGVDVIIGVVETHGRRETEALLADFEIVPRQQIAYKDRALDEMDIDAIIARRPGLVLVDELAHSNAVGSRHPKRYLDVEEILDHGIDVYTTLNIQHVESLNDIVMQITRIKVRETVPDSVIDNASDVELIDLTPEDLIKRLHEGKVYMPLTAEQAVRNYFSPGNLTALRELALRRTAQRVDDQLLSHMQSHAISGPWAAGDRVAVCIDARENGPALIRYTRRLADRLRAPWVALHIETARSATLSEKERDRLAATMRFAAHLGGTTEIIPGENVAEEIIRYASEHNITHVISGKPHRSGWRAALFGSTTPELIRRAGNISIHVVSGDADKNDTGHILTAAKQKNFNPIPYLYATVFVGVALLLGLLLDQTLDVRNIGLVFLMAVLASAVMSGLMPALFASILSTLTYNFFFLPPLHTLRIADPESAVALFFFLLIAVTASNLTAAVQRQAAAARQRARSTAELYLFSKKLAGTGTLDDVLWVTVYQVALMLKLRVVVLLPEQGSIAVRAGYPPDDTLADADIAAAHWAFEHSLPAGRGAETLTGAKRLYLPLRTGRTTVGVIGLDNDGTGPLLTPEQQRLLDALADQAAVAIERVQLVAAVEHAAVAAEADRLRSALLTSISHDLKTPLAAVIGAAGTLKEFAASLPEVDQHELLATVIEESDRLNRFIANLLDMTRLEAGATVPNYGIHDVGDIIGATLNRMSKITAHHRMSVEVAPHMPMVRVDPVLLEQALFNLIDNATKYADIGSMILLSSWTDDGEVFLRVSDEGPGIPPEDLTRIFDTFYRANKGDHTKAGTGLGLAVSKGFIEAMGGGIFAANRTDRQGALFVITLPAAAPLETHIKQDISSSEREAETP